jgi:hypothetical protein
VEFFQGKDVANYKYDIFLVGFQEFEITDRKFGMIKKIVFIKKPLIDANIGIIIKKISKKDH